MKLGTTPLTSFNLDYLFKDPVSPNSQVLRYWGLGFQRMNVGVQHNSAHDKFLQS